MRYQELFEYKVDKYLDYNLYSNPSSKELRLLLNKYSELRGLTFGKKFVVWDANADHHLSVYEYLTGKSDIFGIDDETSIYLSWTDDIQADEWDMDDHWSNKEQDEIHIGLTDETGKEHPMVQRAIG